MAVEGVRGRPVKLFADLRADPSGAAVWAFVARDSSGKQLASRRAALPADPRVAAGGALAPDAIYEVYFTLLEEALLLEADAVQLYLPAAFAEVDLGFAHGEARQASRPGASTGWRERISELQSAFRFVNPTILTTVETNPATLVLDKQQAPS